MTPLVAVSRCPAAAGVISSHHHPPGAQLLPCIIDSVDPSPDHPVDPAICVSCQQRIDNWGDVK